MCPWCVLCDVPIDTRKTLLLSPSISAARKILLEACVYAFQRTYLYLQVRNAFAARYKYIE